MVKINEPILILHNEEGRIKAMYTLWTLKGSRISMPENGPPFLIAEHKGNFSKEIAFCLTMDTVNAVIKLLKL